MEDPGRVRANGILPTGPSNADQLRKNNHLRKGGERVSKYQSALNTLFMMASEHLGFELHYERKALQELIDKDTPKKLENDKCPECQSEFEYMTSYCSLCGQSIDWDDQFNE